MYGWSIMKGQQRQKLRLLVHFSYFENNDTTVCDLRIKRANLVAFVRAAVRDSPVVDFVFTISGILPEPSHFYKSIGLPALYADTIFPIYKNVRIVYSSAHIGTPDLCHHGQVMSELLNPSSRQYDMFLFMNDGVLAPLFTHADISIINLSQTARLLPPWLSPLSAMFDIDPHIAAVGPIVSCERSLHLQGWYVLVKVEAIRNFSLHEHFIATCKPKMSWEAAIDTEVGFSSKLLDGGLKIAALYPQKTAFGREDTISPGRLSSRVDSCKNPITVASTQRRALHISRLGALKVGGNFFRADIFNDELRVQIKAAVEKMVSRKSANLLCAHPS